MTTSKMIKKLVLARETLRTIGSDDLSRARGGLVWKPTVNDSCQACYSDIKTTSCTCSGH